MKTYVPDLFYIKCAARHFGQAEPNERRILLRYMRNLVRECEKMDVQLSGFRRYRQST
jgi:hypothetical protein